MRPAQIAALQKERNEADRQAGELMRRIRRLEEDERGHADWLRKAKDEAGYHENESFDIVWNRTLAKAKLYDLMHSCAACSAVLLPGNDIARCLDCHPNDNQQADFEEEKKRLEAIVEQGHE